MLRRKSPYLRVLGLVLVLVDRPGRLLARVAELSQLSHKDFLLVVSLGLGESEDWL